MKAELIDLMGTDLSVVNSARVSFDKASEWEVQEFGTNGKHGTTEVLSERDQKLINYLARHNHWTPFSHVMISMRETVPIFVARQRFKSSVGFTYNEVSRRYVDDEPEFYYPESWRQRADNKKQGSLDTPIEHGDVVSEGYVDFIEHCKCFYQDLLDSGVAPEQARIVLPQSMYTSYYVTGSLAAWARAYKLRIAEDSQREIQDLAKQWGEIIGNIEELKYSWAALTKG